MEVGHFGVMCSGRKNGHAAPHCYADAKNQKKKKAKKLFTTSTLEISNPTIL
jgi:hypothetical protein